MIFDDQQDNYREKYRSDYMSTNAEVTGYVNPMPRVTLNYYADGMLGGPLPRSGIEIFPMSHGFHKVHEAGIFFFQDWMKFSNTEIKDFRAECLDYFKNVIMINGIQDVTRLFLSGK